VVAVTEGTAAPSAGSLWRTPGLAVLFTASTSARLANETARLAVVFLVLRRTGSPALSGALVAALSFPQLVTGPVLGAWLDRTAHRRTAFVANQVVLPSVLLGLLALIGHAPSWALVALASVAGVTAPVLTGGFTGLIGPLVPAGLLRRAYGAESTSYNVAGVGGPALAGAVSGWVSPDAAMVTAVLMSGVALLAVLRVPMPPPEAAPGEHLLRAVGAGLRHLATQRTLRSATLGTTLSYAGMGALPVVLPALAQRLGAGAATGGALLSTFAVGALLSSVVLAARAPQTDALLLAFLGVGGVGVAAAGLALAPTLALAFGAVALLGVAESPVVASTLTVRDRTSPPHMRTQVVTTAASLKIGAYAVGSAVTGHLVAGHGARAGAWLLVGCQVAGLVLGLAALGRRRRTGRAAIP
jgi:MFS family permease